MSRIVPWSCREEWLETYHNLYSTEKRMQGIQKVDVWRSRSGRKLPLAVEMTASLVAANMDDVKSHVNPHVVRHTIAMAIVRFVNGMVDMEQKGAYARSVQSIADEIGLPDWLVDLRHEATHAHLPSLQVLRAGRAFALHWLQHHYWESQIEEFQTRDQELFTLLGKYAEVSENFKTGEKQGKNSKSKKLAQEIADLVGKYNMWQRLLEFSFGEKASLLPSSEVLEKILSETTDILLKLPQDICQWLSLLLKVLHKTNEQFLSNFVSFLVRRIHGLEQHDKTKLEVHFFSCLVYFVLLNCSKKDSKKKQSWDLKADLDYLSLLEVCLKNPSKNNHHFLPLIIDNLKTLSESLKDKLYKFSAIKITFNKDESATENVKTDLATLKQHFPQIAKQLEARLAQSGQDNSVWQKCPPSFASTYKFGAFSGEEPWQEQNLNEVNDETFEMEDNTSITEQCEPGWIEGNEIENGFENGSESEFQNGPYENEESQIPCAPETSNTARMNELTEDLIKEISMDIYIF